MKLVLGIAAMGALGAVARHLCGLWVKANVDLAFPLATLLINGLGSFLLGLLAGLASSGLIPEHLRGPLAIGLLGSFTTFSTFSLETLALADTGRPGAALLNVLLQVGIGVMAAGAGLLLGRAGAT